MKNNKNLTEVAKIDAHNHLNLGMQYITYKDWAGFDIPNFPRKLNGLDEMHKIIAAYTRPRCKKPQDVIDLINMSITDAIADGVTILEGSVDLSFVGTFKEDFDKFFSAIDKIVKKYEGKIDFRPELGVGKTFDKTLSKKWIPACIESGIFKSVDLYGPEVEEGIQDIKYLYTEATKHGLKKKAHVGEFSDAASVKKFVEFFELDEVQHGIGAVNDDSVLKFLADNHIRCNVTPWSNVMLGAAKDMKTHPIKKMIEAGVPVSVGTDDLLFFNKTVSEQLEQLLKEKTLTQTQIDLILKEK